MVRRSTVTCPAAIGLIWVVLLIVEFTRGLSPLLATFGTVIWIVFIADFIVRIVIAPGRWKYLQHNWLTAISLRWLISADTSHFREPTNAYGNPTVSPAVVIP